MDRNKKEIKMKYTALPIFLFTISQYVYAEGPEDFIGKFKGSEAVVITCQNSAWNKSETRPWETNHSDLNGNSFKGVTKSGGGKYDVEGTISGNTATGTFKGKDGHGNACNGNFTDTLDDDQLTVTITGNCPSVNCEFKGDVTAKRQ